MLPAQIAVGYAMKEMMICGSQTVIDDACIRADTYQCAFSDTERSKQ